MKFQAIVDAARMTLPLELGGRRVETGDYLVCGDGPEFLVLKAAVFEAIFRPVNGGPPKAAREPKEAAEEPGRKFQGEMKELVLKALGEGPKRSREVGDWIRAHGLAEYTNTRASAILTYLGNRGQVARGKDKLWRVKG
jgi:hypothetical protein